jgi:predicted nucleic acid-binding protein
VNIAVDTNRYVDFMRGEADALAKFRAASRITLPYIVLGELRAGFACGSRARGNEKALARLLSRSRVQVIWADESTTHLYAQILAELRRRGTPIPTNDLWIAALAIQHGLPLYTRDAHFQNVSGLATI